jgi:predicted O-methyltransferase YrrM
MPEKRVWSPSIMGQLEQLWPPREGATRVADKIRHTGFQLAAERYQKTNPGVPWMPQRANEILEGMLRPTDRCLEWGAGDSTTWLGARCASILSVEHDPTWYQKVRGELVQQGQDPDSVQLLSIEPADRPAETPYVRAVDAFGDGELDVCFVDGEHRPTCITEVMPKLTSGGLLIVDDVHGYLDHPSHCVYSREGIGHLSDAWRDVYAQLGTWRMIWTGDGYSDAAIWIKP